MPPPYCHQGRSSGSLHNTTTPHNKSSPKTHTQYNRGLKGEPPPFFVDKNIFFHASQHFKNQKKSKLGVCISWLPSTPSGAPARAKNTIPAGDPARAHARRGAINTSGAGAAGNRYGAISKIRILSVGIRGDRGAIQSQQSAAKS